LREDTPIIQISSGQGPDECELAVSKLFDAFCREFPAIRLIEQSPGRRPGCFKSIRFHGNEAISRLEGSVLWRCQSPFRPKHGRKNWFVDVSVCADADAITFDEARVRYETFRSSGKGGQHVNKTESAIRAIYEPTGDSIVMMDERSQYRNKQIAVARLKQLITEKNQASQNSAKMQNWLEHYRIVRGNPSRVYEGLDFKEIK